MGIVYQAVHRRDKRVVAIKQLVTDNIDQEKQREFKDRFRREAATAERLVHPNIVKVLDVSNDSDNFYYVMEYLEGHSLRRELEMRGGRMDAEQFFPLLKQVAEGLSFAHSMNVVHRDVKPDNIFILKDGRVKLTDFGIARAMDLEETKLTKTGVMLGTLAYVSPEQLQDARSVDHRADIFSLGVVTYECLSASLPFTGDGIAATIVRIVSHEEKPLHILMPHLSVDLSACVSKAMRKRARERYRSVLDFCRDFERSLGKHIPENDTSGSVDVSAMLPPVVSTQEELPVIDIGGALSPAELKHGVQHQVTPLEYGAQKDSRESKQKEYKEYKEYKNSRDYKDSKGSTRFRDQVSNAERQPLSPVKVITLEGKNNVLLVEPAVVCYWSGRLIVADSGTRKLHIYSFDGRWIHDALPSDSGKDSRTMGGTLTKPSGVAVDARGRMYVCDSSDHYIRIFDGRGHFIREFKNIQGTDGGLQGIAVDSTGLIYVSDVSNGCLQVFQSDLGAWMRKVGSKGDRPGQFQLPAGLAVDRLNQVYCADYGTSRISIFNKAGIHVRSFGEKGNADGLFNVPRSVAIDKNDKIYVLDSLNHRVQVFGPTGDWLCTIGGRGSEPGKFIGPSDLAINNDNDFLYVADKGNKRVQVFDLCLI